jgi:hypothetical protein
MTKASTKQQIVSLLRHFAKEIQAMDDEEVQRILDGELKMEIRAPQRAKTKPRQARGCSDAELHELQDSLGRTSTRERALELINAKLQSKADLTRFARVIDIPVSKEASSGVLRDRLVEATVGYRIRSAAVRGNATVPLAAPGNGGGTGGEPRDT